MSKKYIYFKLFRDLDDPIESETLSEFEIAAYLENYEPIQNVFQLYQNNELKLLINKSQQLQNLLTKSLPRHGFRHGYLWSGEQFPDFTRLLSSCSLIEECIAFQKTTDPLPPFKSSPIFQLKRQFEIYNWYAFYFRSFQYYFDKSSKIAVSGESEVAIDWFFESLWEKQKRTENIEDLPAYETNEPACSSTTLNFISHDKRAYTKSRNLRWIRPILNYLHSSKDKILYIPFVGKGEIFFEGLFSGKKMVTSEINPIRYHYLLGSSFSYKYNLIRISQAISEIISQIRVLTTSQPQVQVDLFVNSTEKQFEKFWQVERERIESLQNNHLSENTIKIISAIRFLIDSEIISKSESINAFLRNGLINLLADLLRDKKNNEIINSYKKELRRLYLDVYIFHKIEDLNQTQGGIKNFYLQNALHSKSIETNSIDSICCFFPSSINKKGFKEDQTIVKILNLHPNSDSLEMQKLGFKKRSKEQIEEWNDEIREKEESFTLLGNYGQNILTRMQNYNRCTEAGLFLKLWNDGYGFLIECSRILKKDGKACLIFRNPQIKINEEFEEINTLEVYKELINKHQQTLQLDIITSFKKTDRNNHFGKLDFYQILLLSGK